jgi:hypothetical protein
VSKDLLTLISLYKKNAVEATDKPLEISSEGKENIVKKHIKYRCHILLRFYF